ncbi:hypothetical protein [Actinoplanes regularis]|uniref:hypothetical protein n=1 Tax=Actinoplanes regularis TaxID=52697 RepID=UPI0025575898|nr:hypothetical protein [Actinoplanes regularis]GLW28131.1 hypothetical protein Areg01_10710 [Actinoplanes regularis]
MPVRPFSVRLDPDELARQDIAAALNRPATTGDENGAGGAAHHGADDSRQTARRHSDRAHAGRAAAAAGSRSYAFRRS